MNLKKELQELLEAKIIDELTAEKISAFYNKKEIESPNKLMFTFGVIGSLLIGLGIILIIAHNWDDLPKIMKLAIAFLPLLVGLVFCGFAYFNSKNNVGWKESSAVFLMLSLGANISLISQIYNVSGSLSSFIFLWMLLTIPVIYIMDSMIVALLFIIGITYYQIETVYGYPKIEDYYYWILLVLFLPFYLFHFFQNKTSNAVSFMNWMVPLSITISFGGLAKHNEEWMFVGYMALFGMFYLIGNFSLFSTQKKLTNGYRYIGMIGTIVLLYSLSFKWFWKNLIHEDIKGWFNSIEFILSILLILINLFLLAIQNKYKSVSNFDYYGSISLWFLPIFTLGLSTWIIPMILINIVILSICIYYIYTGIHQKDLSTMNFGLIVLSILIICRFLDSNLSFVNRGLIFITIGLCFFFANYRMVQYIKNNHHVE